ncbi:MAG: hypothetical protein A3F74_05100 [Betaproteobacteria bacterium RIFCSPLOWO2_12_FULL_62_58]|nr:MAG: hypothetical protein A3F74_05100 [Betaproteobacteria bacterium RIFCSPLOWO2_12_FULL_62_58]
MNLHQLRYVCEIVRCKLNISRAARSLGTSQPAISQQVRLLEEELGTTIFLRSRSGLTGLTGQGESIVEAAQHVLAEVANVQGIAQGHPPTSLAKIRVASTQAQARYALPSVIRRFHLHYPGISVHISHKHDEEESLWQMVQNGIVDLAITTSMRDLPKSLLALECFPMERSLIVPKRHPLLKQRIVTLESIAAYPLITHAERSTGRRRIMRAFGALGFTPKVTVTAVDEDVIKACVEEGLGITILASIVYDPERDTKLRALDVTPLLEPSVTGVVVRRDMARHDHICAFIEAFAPMWTKDKIAHEIKL